MVNPYRTMILVPLLFAMGVSGSPIPEDKKAVKVECPIDKHTFNAWMIDLAADSNDDGGTDADFCKHPLQGKTCTYLVWVCPKCHYAGQRRDFVEMVGERGNKKEAVKEITPANKKKIQGKLKPAIEIKKEAKQEDISGWVKSDLAAQMYTLLGYPAMDIGKMFLNASWAARQEGAISLTGDADFDELWRAYGFATSPTDLKNDNRTEFELKKVKSLEEDIAAGKLKEHAQTMAYYLAALVYRKHGENHEALQWIEQVKKIKDKKPVLDNPLKKMEESIAIEKRYQKKAAEMFEKLIKEEEKHGDAPDVQYILGELYRRLDDRKNAEHWFTKCIENEFSSETHREIARRQMNVMNPKK